MTGNRTLPAILMTLALVAGCVTSPPAETSPPGVEPTTAETPTPTVEPTTGEDLLHDYYRIIGSPPAREVWRCCDYVGSCRQNPTLITLTVNDRKPLTEVFERMRTHQRETGEKMDVFNKFLDTFTFDNEGTIALAGSPSQKTQFQIKGLYRRWDWGSYDDADESSLKYTLVISPNGTGRYYDFSLAEKRSDGKRTTKSSDLFKCERH